LPYNICPPKKRELHSPPYIYIGQLYEKIKKLKNFHPKSSKIAQLYPRSKI
jgi:hypothetical protein